jgi:hypothetical protein
MRTGNCILCPAVGIAITRLELWLFRMWTEAEEPQQEADDGEGKGAYADADASFESWFLRDGR